MEYVLSWQATIAVFAVIMVVMWFLGSVVKCPRPLALLLALAIAFAIKHYWWFIDAKFMEWMRFMGLEV